MISLRHTTHSVGLLWTSDKPVAKTPTWQHTTPTTDRYHCPGGIRTHSLNRRAAANPRLRPRGHSSPLHCRLQHGILKHKKEMHYGWHEPSIRNGLGCQTCQFHGTKFFSVCSLLLHPLLPVILPDVSAEYTTVYIRRETVRIKCCHFLGHDAT